MEGKINEIGELENLCVPIIKYLKKKHNPHTRLMISVDSISLMVTEIGIPLESKIN